MNGYVGWVAIAALVIAVSALGIAVSEIRRRKQRDSAALELYEAVQGYRLTPGSPFEEKWTLRVKEPKQWSADLNEAVYRPVSESDLSQRYQRP